MSPTAILATSLSSVAWSLFDFSRKKLAAKFEPIPVVIWLMLLQTPLFFLFLASERWIVAPAPYWLPAAASILLNAIANVCFIFAVQLAPLSLAIPMLSLGPVFSVLAGFGLLGEAVSTRQLGGIAVIVASAYALGRAGALHGRREQGDGRIAKGLLLMTLVAALWSTTPVLDKICLQYVPASEHGFLQCLSVALILLGLNRAKGKNNIRLSQLKTGALWFGIAVFVAWAALMTQFWAIQLVTVGIFESLKRAIGMFSALLLGLVFFNEPVTRGKALAIVAMAAGVFILLA